MNLTCMVVILVLAIKLVNINQTLDLKCILELINQHKYIVKFAVHICIVEQITLI